MSFHQSCKRFLQDEGYEYLGEEYGIVFYKNTKKRVFGASEFSIVERMKEKGYWAY